jgi:hypothetical protein
MWHKSNIKDKLRPLLLELDISNMLYIYSNLAYGCAFGVISAYRRTLVLPLSQEQLALNKSMAKVRILVENIFRLNVRI